MENKQEKSQTIVHEDLKYFDLQAAVGTTKHMGGLLTTRELMRLCVIEPHFRVLDVGSGAGATACYLAQKTGCEVVGIDLHPKMVELGRARARRKGLEHRITFQQGDVQSLPFEEETFDIVLCESVLSFVENKKAALEECRRVLRPGGLIGLNEEVWLQDPTEELLKGAEKVWGLPSEVMKLGDWIDVLTEAGFINVHGQMRRVQAWREATQVLRYSAGDMMEMFSKALGRYLKDPAFRAYMRERKKLPRGLFKMLAYGLYHGTKVV
ncbi:MAG: methyltransferase domain-containing protein [Anaerolineales bacterium]|nr:methyltransferase domain-containing protein [Anaerolineales bacterium]